ncbi:MAG TPA: CPBP family intramembrane glutamic endopeptidase, partial [Anaerolineales bacterium]|nr:CPBP family intramembrane glutamic endopeptidase [Anaerolineales bacterium]
MFVVIRAILTYVTGANGESQSTMQRVVFLGGAFLILSVGLTYFGFTRWVGVDLRRWWKLERKRLPGDIGWGLLGFILAFLINIGFVLLASKFGLIPQEAAMTQATQPTLADWLLNLFFGFAIAGFQEETIVRGFLMDALAHRFNLIWSMIIQALVFSLAHIGYFPLERWIFFILAFVMGLLFGALKLKRGSLITAWI